MNREMAELIASRIASRHKPTALYKFPVAGCGVSFQLKTPSQMRKAKGDGFRYNSDYVGTYDHQITPEQIMVDWGHDE